VWVKTPVSSLGLGGTRWMSACAGMAKLTILANQVFISVHRLAKARCWKFHRQKNIKERAG
jgi:hypothetical protein